MTGALAGFDRMQSTLDPAGPQAARIAHLWWLLFWVSVVVFAAVIVFLVYAVVRARVPAAVPPAPELATPRHTRWWMALGVGTSTALTVIVLFVLLGVSVVTGRALASLGRSDALSITVTGHQWWWEIEYEDAVPARRLVTANELHVPVGRPVLIKTVSHDVIHSLWVPNLHGKRDLIPGQEASLWIQADRSGTFRGQCAEFCGLQHAHMALLVIAEPEAEFQAWLEAQRRPAAEPQSELARRGQQVFQTGPCVLCHRVRGSLAGGRVAPDLTHLASRRTLAAGTLPNTTGALAGWMVDSQHVKPGNLMPSLGLSSDELQALLAYLGGLS